MKTIINQYEKSINKCYSVATENVIDKAEYFTNKKYPCARKLMVSSEKAMVENG